MYARTTTINADPAKIDAGVAHVRDQILPAVTAMPGCVGMSLLVSHGSGLCIATTAWDSEAALNGSAPQVLSLRSSAEQALGAEPGTVELWDVAVVHRVRATAAESGARVTWFRSDPHNVDRAVDTFRMAVLPQMQQLDGFCSASILINRETGRRVGTVTFDSARTLEASRDAMTRIREAGRRDTDSTVEDVADMEVAFAHLHVPEMA